MISVETGVFFNIVFFRYLFSDRRLFQYRFFFIIYFQTGAFFNIIINIFRQDGRVYRPERARHHQLRHWRGCRLLGSQVPSDLSIDLVRKS